MTHIFYVKFISDFDVFRYFYQLYDHLAFQKSVKTFFIRYFFFIKSFKTVDVFIWISIFCFSSSKFLESNY